MFYYLYLGACHHHERLWEKFLRKKELWLNKFRFMEHFDSYSNITYSGHTLQVRKSFLDKQHFKTVCL